MEGPSRSCFATLCQPSHSEVDREEFWVDISDEYAVEVGDRIVRARKETGLTQVELAELTGASQRAMQGYENGERIPYRLMPDIARVVNKPMAWLLHGDRAMVGTDEQLARIEQKLDDLLLRFGKG